jgi:hypothetical protein
MTEYFGVARLISIRRKLLRRDSFSEAMPRRVSARLTITYVKALNALHYEGSIAATHVKDEVDLMFQAISDNWNPRMLFIANVHFDEYRTPFMKLWKERAMAMLVLDRMLDEPAKKSR